MNNYMVTCGGLFMILSACEHKVQEGECGTTTGGISNVEFIFSDANFSCQDNPIEPGFSISLDTFVSLGDMEESDVILDFASATSAWSGLGADLQINVETLSLETPLISEEDYESHIFMMSGPDLVEDSINALASTRLWVDGGVAHSCDIVFFTEYETAEQDISWVSNGDAAPWDVDLAYIVAHELGHCVGLGDQNHISLVDDLMWYDYTGGVDFGEITTYSTEAALYLYGAE